MTGGDLYPEFVARFYDVVYAQLRDGADNEFYLRYEIEHLVARSRLRLKALHGNFGGGGLVPDSKEFVVSCRRTED